MWGAVGVLTVVEVVDWVVGGPTAGLGPGLRRMILVLLILSLAANLLVLAIRRGMLRGSGLATLAFLDLAPLSG